MSEAELHILKGRLQGGIKNKARRGELEVPLPIGLVYHPNGSVALDPDQQVRGALQLLFDTFRQAASATATVKRFRQEGWLFPRRIRRGIGKGDLIWGGVGTLSRHPDTAQPPLCRCLRVRSHARSISSGTQILRA